ncbi:hypothetical protein BRD09_08645 [Halobacteriales archaeon SW_10_68_16]|jgi:hypothetical protein|nr:MAG: hypothetical protein BRD09_08645 [Halobacteriales archaeon SW_10_68_16]
MEDASLDEFLDSGDGETGDEEATAGDTEAGGVESEEGATEGEAVAPATATYEWSPGGTECPSCGGTVRRRWHSESGLLCAECKEW